MESNSDFWQALDKLVSQSRVIIDRPRGSSHPNFPDMVYPIDYGYLENTSSMDGGGIDVWKGSDPEQAIDAIMCIVDMEKRDAEIKILIGCTESEKQSIVQFHNASDKMKGIIIYKE